MHRPRSLRPSLLGAFTLLSALALLAPGCLTTGAVQCGDEGFCPPGTVCTEEQDPPVCVPVRGCGNGEVDDTAGEVCDDGNVQDGDGCNSTCTSDETCGNRFTDRQIDEPEECDQGEETSTCDDDCTEAECGDGNLNKEADEVCDDGNTEAGDGCDDNCKSEECGNGITEPAFDEECDDGKHCENGTKCTDDEDCTEGDRVCKPRNDDDCSADCQAESCGNSKRDPGEQCDDGNDNNNDSCVILSNTECANAYCGDGQVWNEDGGDEECDDGEETSRCNANCTPARCGDGIINELAGEQCDDSGEETTTCDLDCTFALCGDGKINGTRGEVCDDGGQSADCNADCTEADCGDGKLNSSANEQCDDGEQTTSCDANCTIASCGDGFVNDDRNETCDTSGETAGCDANCTAATCGDGTTNQTALEECDTSGQTFSCDADCTFATCGDGTRNIARDEDCDAAGESASCNVDCSTARCGDGKLNSLFVLDLLETDATLVGEECDPNTGTTTNAARADEDSEGCDRDCSTRRCGDAYVNEEADEACDEVYMEPGDTPPNRSDCDRDCTRPACGDGLVNVAFSIRFLYNETSTYPSEQCDPDTGTLDDAKRADGDSEGCDHDCSTARCGDQYKNETAGETCEYPYTVSGPSSPRSDCDLDCTDPECGDGQVNGAAGEDCDPDTGVTSGNADLAQGHSSTCDRDCTNVDCGDGVVNGEADEECDDTGNDSDACVDCKNARCGDGHEWAGEETCDPGTPGSPVTSSNPAVASDDSSSCDRDCTTAECGDGYVNDEANEECDDENTTNGDGCSSTCKDE